MHTTTTITEAARDTIYQLAAAGETFTTPEARRSHTAGHIRFSLYRLQTALATYEQGRGTLRCLQNAIGSAVLTLDLTATEEG
jgi:hypothetical protein